MDDLFSYSDNEGSDAANAETGDRDRKSRGSGGEKHSSSRAQTAGDDKSKTRRNRTRKGPSRGNDAYSAKDIEVLEGLEPVRRRPGMYIGGTDENALHHLASEVLDNAMDEAVAGHASRIDIDLDGHGRLTIADNGRGIPVDAHPKAKNKSALEVILTTLHSGGKFNTKVYETSGGLHGVGLSVVNALAEELSVEVARDRRLWHQSYRRGVPDGSLKDSGAVNNRRGTTVSFVPDSEIFDQGAAFRPARIYRLARSKAYLFRGVEIRWSCSPSLLGKGDATPEQATLHFPGGLVDFLKSVVDDRPTLTPAPFSGEAKLSGGGKVEWAIAWPLDEEAFLSSYCNTVPTPAGGTHEQGLRNALVKGLKAHGELVKNKQAAKVTAEDILGGATVMLSVFMREPQFQGQTKEKLVSSNAAKLVESALRDHFDHWLSGDPKTAATLLEHVVERARNRLQRREDKQTKRQSATRKLRLPGKLSDCTRNARDGTEIFIVEGDSAGGSAKQGRIRETQAVLPLRGKILNVASASRDKLKTNQEINDLVEALGCGTRASYREEDLRYERVIIMTDADVDGAHIASLLMTFFFKEMPQLIEEGYLYLAMPPLYRLTQGGKSVYARDDAHKDALLESEFAGRGKVEISRFKGLGEMPPAQLRETTMDPEKRVLLRVRLEDLESGADQPDAQSAGALVETLMGKSPEKRFAYIQEHARFVDQIDV